MITLLAALSLTGITASVRADDQVTPAVPAPTQETTTETAPAPEPNMILLPGESDKWVFTSPLFFWIAGLKGDIAAKGQKVDVDLSPTEIMDHTDIGFTGWFDLTKDRLGFYINPTFMRLEADAKFAAGKANESLEQWIVEFGAHYNVWQWSGPNRGNLAVVAGGRYWSIHNDLTLKPTGGPNSHAIDSEDLFDPIIGLRYQQYYTEKIHSWVQGDVGGFDISESQSRFSWQIMPAIGYDFMMPVIKKPSTVFAGFRMIGIEHEKGGPANKSSINLKYYGAIFGLNVIFF
jgi:hypothetical protein